jgi:hypothetical protein
MRQLNDLFGERPPKTKYVRKKDGQVYWSDLKPYRQEGYVYLVPHWWGGRSHWKSLAAFKAQYTNLDGSKIE